MRRRPTRHWPAAATVAIAAALAIAGCSSSVNSAADSGSSVAYQLGWLPNIEDAGTWISLEKGYFKDEGVTVSMINGGPTVSVPAVVSSGKALIGVTGLDEAAAADQKGANLKVIGFLFQKTPYGIVSLKRNPIPNPKAMVGKRIGVPAVNLVAWNAFTSMNGITKNQATVVPTTESSGLLDGQTDGQMAYLTNEPTQQKMIDAGIQGFSFSDYGYQMATQAFVVDGSSLADAGKRKKIEGFMRAVLRGWQISVNDPNLGAQLAVQKYGKDLGLDLEQQQRESVAQNALISTTWTKEHGIATISPQLLSDSFATIARTGVKAKPDDVVDMSVLAKVYANGPTL
ncbi:ABC transporter substrate-binding protein [Gordonia sp. DT30]|uniref:ABC transporter substrate-binding protein n=1 Tax=Gordonia sp. DT30 TaxID=3416546 RepID=UPI003CF442A0